MSPAEELVATITTEEMVAALRAFPADGRAPADNRMYLVWLHMEAIGLIESHTQESACKACGRPKIDFSWHRISKAGCIVLEMAGDAE